MEWTHVVWMARGSRSVGRPFRGQVRSGARPRRRRVQNFSKSYSSGNKAFDDYREATLKRLEEEEREFRSFLDRLRRAEDKSEFDQFMSERRERPAGSESTA